MHKQVIRNKQTLAQVEEQTQVLKPLLQAEVRILRMSQQEFEQDVRAQLDTNPALEQEDEDSADNVLESDMAQADKSEFSKEDYDNERINDYAPDDVPGYYDPDNNSRERVVADQKSLYDNLKEQAASCKLTPKQERIMDYLIGSLDEDGFLRKSPRVFCDEMEIYDGIEASVDEVAEVIRILQTFEPVGIGAKDLQESLIIQMRVRYRGHPLRDKAIDVLTRGLDDYINRRYHMLCSRFRLTRVKLDTIYDLVSHLDPRPGSSGASADNIAVPVSPDFLVEETDDGFDISLCRGHIPRIKVSTAYSDYVASANGGASGVALESARRQVNEAKLYVAAVKQRQHTMLDTMRAIVHLQPEYFHEGDRSLLHPMTQKDVADIIHRDPSTVSGVVSNKYADTAFGLIPLASLFTQSFVNRQGEEISREAVRIKMRELIDGEDSANPLSDDELAERLGIARRTVAKYRKQMHIPVARLRR